VALAVNGAGVGQVGPKETLRYSNSPTKAFHPDAASWRDTHRLRSPLRRSVPWDVEPPSIYLPSWKKARG
jgi:hypothetical protein